MVFKNIIKLIYTYIWTFVDVVSFVINIIILNLNSSCLFTIFATFELPTIGFDLLIVKVVNYKFNKPRP